HLVEENNGEQKSKQNKLGALGDVLHGKTVLIADDDVRNIFSLSKILEKYQVNVISTINGKEALEELERNDSISIVLMDMMMPEMASYESIQSNRQHPKYNILRIVFVTAKAMTSDQQKSIQAGASDYFSQPVDKDQLFPLFRVWF